MDEKAELQDKSVSLHPQESRYGLAPLRAARDAG